MKQSAIPIKLSCIITPENQHEINSGEYFRKAAELGIKRLAIRQIHSSQSAAKRIPVTFFGDLTPVSTHSENPVYDVMGMQVTHWVFDSTSGRSLNLFANGVLSDYYLLSKAQKM